MRGPLRQTLPRRSDSRRGPLTLALLDLSPHAGRGEASDPVLATRLRVRAMPHHSQAKPSMPPLKERRRSADRRFQRDTASPQTRLRKRKRSAMRRALFAFSSPACGGGPRRGRSPFGAPPQVCRVTSARSRAGASWNHRVQTGGPSPAPVQRAPRSPITRRTGRLPKPLPDAVYRHARQEPLPLRLKEYPREGVLGEWDGAL
jgi:hypothetical protein